MKRKVEKYKSDGDVYIPHLLHRALETVNSRDAQYGDPVKSWHEIAQVASIITGKDLTAIDCIKVLQAMKQVRERYKPQIDNRLDLCGYVEIENRIKTGGKNEPAV